MTRRIRFGSAAGALLAVALATGVGGALARSTVASPVSGARCSAVQNPTGDLLVTSDLPLRGAGRPQALQMSQAIAFVFAQAAWTAGGYTIAYQSCDDTTAQSGHWDPATCSANAKAYAADPSVVAIVGPANSGCAESELAEENRAPKGPLAAVSPSTTYVGLTHSGPGTAAGEPAAYYPTGARSYARVVAANDVQAAADATLASRLKVTKLFVLNDKEAYGAGMAASTAAAAKKLGIAIVKNVTWDPSATAFDALAGQIKASGAQAVFLGGLLSGSSGKLIAAVKTAAPSVIILAPDGFTPISADVAQSGGKANGMYVSVAGLPNVKLPAAGRRFLKAFAASIGGGPVDPSAVYAAQSAAVVLRAIAASDGTRAGVASQLLKTDIKKGVVGPISFDANGDVIGGPVTIYKVVAGKPTISTIIVPKSSLLAAP